ncbi:hypothetical protein HZB03_00995 [Candidatus Woesearchaeota archaeon]|nr:hypothetical protein [Candidatus Woesearchaeota archaeon]
MSEIVKTLTLAAILMVADVEGLPIKKLAHQKVQLPADLHQTYNYSIEVGIFSSDGRQYLDASSSKIQSEFQIDEKGPISKLNILSTNVYDSSSNGVGLSLYYFDEQKGDDQERMKYVKDNLGQVSSHCFKKKGQDISQDGPCPSIPNFDYPDLFAALGALAYTSALENQIEVDAVYRDKSATLHLVYKNEKDVSGEKTWRYDADDLHQLFHGKAKLTIYVRQSFPHLLQRLEITDVYPFALVAKLRSSCARAGEEHACK